MVTFVTHWQGNQIMNVQAGLCLDGFDTTGTNKVLAAKCSGSVWQQWQWSNSTEWSVCQFTTVIKNLVCFCFLLLSLHVIVEMFVKTKEEYRGDSAEISSYCASIVTSHYCDAMQDDMWKFSNKPWITNFSIWTSVHHHQILMLYMIENIRGWIEK